jgi:hypothetical protein
MAGDLDDATDNGREYSFVSMSTMNGMEFPRVGAITTAF